MEAKVIKTGEIVEVHYWYQKSDTKEPIYRESSDLKGDRSWSENELDFIGLKKHTDRLGQRRFELTKAALNGMLAHSRNGHGYHPKDPHMNWHDAIAEESIEIADSVITKLKEW